MKRMALVVMGLVAALAGSEVVYAQAAGDLSEPEQMAMSDTIQYALENNRSNQSSDWVNPDSGNSGGIVPVRTYTDPEKGPCREFITTIVIGGEQQQGYGTACRQPDGTWELVTNPDSTSSPPPVLAQAPVYVTQPPPVYYYYPYDFYSPFRIYLSFGYVYRGGVAYRGLHYLDGRTFHRRHPIHIRERVYISPRELERRPWFNPRPSERLVERRTIYRGHDRQVDRRWWQDRDRDDNRRGFNDRGRRDSNDRGRRDSNDRGRRGGDQRDRIR